MSGSQFRPAFVRANMQTDPQGWRDQIRLNDEKLLRQAPTSTAARRLPFAAHQVIQIEQQFGKVLDMRVLQDHPFKARLTSAIQVRL